MTEPNHDVDACEGDVEAILAEHGLRSSLISEVNARSAQGRPFDAKNLLDEHPELGARKSIVLDLAYEEFCQRTEAGESVDAEGYCREFPAFERSLRHLIEVHEFLDENPDLLPAVDVDWPEPGHTFQGYSVLAELGRGAFARVFLAREIALGNRLVAIKVSVHGAAEAGILGRLQHPGIVPVFSVQQDDQTGLTVICMPYRGRATLFDVLGVLYDREERPTRSRSILEATHAYTGESLPSGDPGRAADVKLSHGSFVDGAIHLGYQLADALAYSHSRGICHSDLKPSNVLITPDGKPMLLDFNLAFDSQAVERRLGGTLPYMAPEQLRAIGGRAADERPAVDERSDIFSLGVILYELLSGSLPFGPIPTKRSNEEIRCWLLERQKSGPISLRAINAEVDRPLADLVESCLARSPDARPQSAGKVAGALRHTRSPARRAKRWTRQHSWLVRSAMATLLLASLAVGYHLWNQDPYAVRELNTGFQFYLQNDYSEAEKHLTLAIESDNQLAEAFFLRARTRQKVGRILLALEDYEEAAQLCSAPEIKACQAYCRALEAHFPDAIDCSEKAIDAGFATAEVYNNLGYSFLLANDFASAVPALNEAIKQDESLRPALHNRALAELRWAPKQGRPVDARAGTDIDNAIHAGPPNGALYLDAARVYSRLEEEPGEHRERIIGYLCEALQLGQSLKTIRRDFRFLAANPDLDAVLAEVVPEGEPEKAVRLVDPLTDRSFQLCAVRHD
ncbi:MAG: protein kinase [Planctomycetes bacterium]|nr:protein kinase [Planctomycetota bacterium]